MIFPGRVTTDARDMVFPLAPSPRRGQEPRWALLGFAAAYAVAVLLGRATRLEGGQLALVWPAAAVGFLWLTHAWGAGRLRLHLLALTAVVVLAYRVTGASDLLAVGLGVANALQALVTAAVLRAGQSEPGRLRSTRDLTALVLACAAGATASSLVGGVVLWQLDGDDLLWTVVAWVMRTCSSSLVLGAFALRLVDRRAWSAVPAHDRRRLGDSGLHRTARPRLRRRVRAGRHAAGRVPPAPVEHVGGACVCGPPPPSRTWSSSGWRSWCSPRSVTGPSPPRAWRCACCSRRPSSRWSPSSC